MIIENRYMKFACSMGFSDIADRMVWPPSLSRDRKWPRLTKYTHSQVDVCLKLEGNIVYWLWTTASAWSMLLSVSRTSDELRTRLPCPSSRTRKIRVSYFRAVDMQIRGSPIPSTTTSGRPGPLRWAPLKDRCALAAPSTTRSPLMIRFTATTARRRLPPLPPAESTSRTVPEKMASACRSRTSSGLSTHERRAASSSRKAWIELDLSR